jgi:hypothetical protein
VGRGLHPTSVALFVCYIASPSPSPLYPCLGTVPFNLSISCPVIFLFPRPGSHCCTAACAVCVQPRVHLGSQ